MQPGVRPMDHQTIAQDVARYLSSNPGTALLIQVVITIFAAAAGAFCGVLFKKTAEHLMNKAHFDELQRQLAESTALVATIKSQIEQSQLAANTAIVAAVRQEFADREWARREWANLRRVKIEELVGKVNECRTYLKRHSDAVDRGEPIPANDPLIQLETIALLYFPELKQQTDAFSLMHKTLVLEGDKLRYFEEHASTKEQKDDVKARRSKHASLAGFTNVRHAKKLSAALINSARGLLQDMMGVKAQQEGAGGQSEAEISETNRP